MLPSIFYIKKGKKHTLQFNHVFIPYSSYWSMPFVRWQGNFAQLHPMMFAADVAKRFLREREITPRAFDALFLGMTIPAEHCFFGPPQGPTSMRLVIELIEELVLNGGGYGLFYRMHRG